jgi:hypothetical protein
VTNNDYSHTPRLRALGRSPYRSTLEQMVECYTKASLHCRQRHEKVHTAVEGTVSFHNLKPGEELVVADCVKKILTKSA